MGEGKPRIFDNSNLSHFALLFRNSRCKNFGFDDQLLQNHSVPCRNDLVTLT